MRGLVSAVVLTLLGAPAHAECVLASWYGAESGNKTASGEKFYPEGMTAAHKTMKLGTHITVTNPSNGRSVNVKVNDRGPYIKGRELDLAIGAFRKIADVNTGVVKVCF